MTIYSWETYHISITILRIKIQEIPCLPLGSDVVCYLLYLVIILTIVGWMGNGIYPLLSSMVVCARLGEADGVIDVPET